MRPRLPRWFAALLLCLTLGITGCKTLVLAPQPEDPRSPPQQPATGPRIVNGGLMGRISKVEISSDTPATPGLTNTAQIARSQLDDFILKADGLTVNNFSLTEVEETRTTIRVRGTYCNRTATARSFRVVVAGLGEAGDLLWAGNVEGQATADGLGVLEGTTIPARPGALNQTKSLLLRLDRERTPAAEPEPPSPTLEEQVPNPTSEEKPPGSPPAIRYTNKKVVKVEFDVVKNGPSGVGAVEVWMTADDGRTWERSPLDHKVSLPIPGDWRPGNAPLRGSVEVTLPREGIVYGVTLLLKSRAGLGKTPPQPGEPPQLRFELDETLPEAKLFGPHPDDKRRGAMLMSWEATDKNLTANPITLEWSPQRTGPWCFVGAAELPNTGKYSWQVPPDVPPAVFLRLTVRDAAGNNAVAQTQEPVLIDRSIPEARIVP
jgi:hypothetical protein